MHDHGRTAVPSNGPNGGAGLAELEVHFVFPMLLLCLSRAHNCATGGSGLGGTPDRSGTPTFGVVRTHGRYGEVRQVAWGLEKAKIASIADLRVLHIKPFRSAPTNICSELSLHSRGMIPKAALPGARPLACEGCKPSKKHWQWGGGVTCRVAYITYPPAPFIVRPRRRPRLSYICQAPA